MTEIITRDGCDYVVDPYTGQEYPVIAGGVTYVLVAAAIVGVVISAYAAYEQSQSQAAAASYNEKVAQQQAKATQDIAEYNAVIAEQQAEHARQTAEYNARLAEIEADNRSREDEARAAESRKRASDMAEISEMDQFDALERGRFASELAEKEAVEAEESARHTRELAAEKEAAIRRRGERELSSLRARVGGSGIDVSDVSGSSLLVQMDAAREIELDALGERLIGEAAASGDILKAEQSRYRGSVAKYESQLEAARIRRSGRMNVAGVEADERALRSDAERAREAGAQGATAARYEGSLQARAATLDAARTRFSGLSRAASLESEARLHRYQGRTATTQGYAKVGSTLLSGAAGVYGTYKSSAKPAGSNIAI